MIEAAVCRLVDSMRSFQPMEDADSWLDARDSHIFDRAWVEAFSRVEDVTPARWVDAAAERAFKFVYELTQNGEVAAYVSDDFDLIGRFADVGVDDPWVAGFVAAYSNGRFPAGFIEPRDRSVFELLRGTDQE